MTFRLSDTCAMTAHAYAHNYFACNARKQFLEPTRILSHVGDFNVLTYNQQATSDQSMCATSKASSQYDAH